MTKWRITEITHYPGTKKESKSYLVEKRFLGFLWWYDPFDDGIMMMGILDHLMQHWKQSMM